MLKLSLFIAEINTRGTQNVSAPIRWPWNTQLTVYSRFPLKIRLFPVPRLKKMIRCENSSPLWVLIVRTLPMESGCRLALECSKVVELVPIQAYYNSQFTGLLASLLICYKNHSNLPYGITTLFIIVSTLPDLCSAMPTSLQPRARLAQS